MSMDKGDVTGPILPVKEDLGQKLIDDLDEPLMVLESHGMINKNEFAVVALVVVVTPIVVAPIVVAPVAPVVVTPVEPSFIPLGRKIKQNQAQQKLGCEICLQERVPAQRRTWDPGITQYDVLKQHLEDKSHLPNFNSISGVSLAAAVMSLSYSTVAWTAALDKGVQPNIDYSYKAHSTAGRVFSFFNALAFSYAGHSVVLEIQATIPSTPEKPSKGPMWKGVVVAYMVVAICYFPVAIIGFWVYGNTVSDNILISFSRRGVLLDSHLCPLCNAAMEDVQHVFFRCDVARVVLRKICRWWDLDWQEICSFSDWDAWFLSFRLSSRLKSILEGVFYVAWWRIWRLRNQLVFDASPPNRSTIFDDIKVQPFKNKTHQRLNLLESILISEFSYQTAIELISMHAFRWYDPPMCQRSVQIIPGLLRSRNELEEILAMEVAFLLDVLSRKRISHKGQKKAKNKQNRARDGKDKVKS
ncbi:lysine histidine transporter 1-like protein [Tanacetum coccineum]